MPTLSLMESLVVVPLLGLGPRLPLFCPHCGLKRVDGNLSATLSGFVKQLLQNVKVGHSNSIIHSVFDPSFGYHGNGMMSDWFLVYHMSYAVILAFCLQTSC